MNNDELKIKITGLFPSATFEEGTEWINISINPSELLAVAPVLRNDPALLFDFLFCLTCIDWKTHFTMVYHFSSTLYRHNLVVKSNLDRENPIIESLSHMWRTAEFHEREVYDLFGVKFLHHPDLRRLFLTDEWKGFPLRKDFEDPVNMINL
ncbi:MAG TPA: NADH-quinone oxidoreductase subunit C [Ferruginibacter sp.]|nr:NADH-quinone oxidoreductase subunit C [Ferruginibacter sp.]